jgi:hypothetical protein
MTTWKKDNRDRSIPGISSIPTGPSALMATSTIAAGDSTQFVVTIFPQSKRLSKWDFLFSVVIDDNVTIIDGLPANLFADGASLTNGQLAMRLTPGWTDWAESSDTTNTRVHKLLIKNEDTVSHTYYVYFKAYTDSSNPSAT